MDFVRNFGILWDSLGFIQDTSKFSSDFKGFLINCKGFSRILHNSNRFIEYIRVFAISFRRIFRDVLRDLTGFKEPIFWALPTS